MSGKTEQASIGHVKRIIRLKNKRHGEHEHTDLNIYPMMDIMTIILVFMIMQLASSSASIIQESPELKIPISNSPIEPDEALPLQISRNELAIEGKRIIALREGNVDPSHKQGGGNGFLITPLFKTVKQIAEQRKAIAKRNAQRQFTGEVMIVADKRTPYRTLTEVLYTLGQAEFKQLRFIANKGGPKGGGS